MACASPSELLEAKLDKVKAELKDWTLELEKVSC
jgi:hypothetical protein